jgi:hypothetical protein
MADYVKLEDLSKLTHVTPKTGHYSEVATDTEYEKRLVKTLTTGMTSVYLYER